MNKSFKILSGALLGITLVFLLGMSIEGPMDLRLLSSYSNAPDTGHLRIVADSTTGVVLCKTSTGANCYFETSGGAGGGTVIWTGTGNPNGGDVAPHNMTSNALPTPYVASCTGCTGGFSETAAYYAFNGTGSFASGEGAGGNSPVLEIDLGTGASVTLASYSITGGSGGNYGDWNNAFPKNFTLSGSNNNSTWTTLDTRTGITWSGGGQTQNFAVTGAAAYRYFEVAITLNSSGCSSGCNGPDLGVIQQLYLNAAGFSGGSTGDFYYATGSNTWYGPRPSGSTPTWPVALGPPSGTGATAVHGDSILHLATGHDIDLPQTCVAASGSATAYTCMTSPTFTPATGDAVFFKADVLNTGTTPTLNVNSSSAATIKKAGTSAVVGGDLVAGQWLLLTYDGTYWQIPGVGNVLPNQLPTGTTTSGANITWAGYQVIPVCSSFPSYPPAGSIVLCSQNKSGFAPSLNQIPTMTSDSAPSGTVSSSTAYATGQDWHAMGGGSCASTGWLTNNVSTGWLQYQFGTATIVNSYSICPWSVDTWNSRVPKTWTFLGSNDGSSWTTLDTQTNYLSWVQSATTTFVFPNATAYAYYRLNITANNGNAYLGVGVFQVGYTGKASLAVLDSSGTITQVP